MNDTVNIRKAYSYQRFSSARQRAGDSLRRQSQATDTFVKEHRLTLVDTFIDKGVSAFRGKNFSDEAALGQFIKLVENGTVEKNCVLVVESMDRLSRDIILPCFNKFIEMINSDIEIGVLSLNKIFNKKSITSNPMELMLVLVEFARANNESEVKSKRSKSVISSKIERMKKGEKFNGLGKPYWVTGLKNGKFILDNDKVTLVKDIFQRYLAGNAATKIASQLNAEAVPTLRGIKGFVWSSMSVLQLLRNKNVIGIMSINGNEIENYYPQIIGEKSFQLVQQKLKFNHSNRGGSVNDYVNNLFRGLLFCSECGKSIEVKIAWYKPINGEVKKYFTYCCSGVHRGTKCLNKGRILVSKIETNFFDFIFMAKINKVNVTKTENVKLVSLENELAKLDMRIERTVKILQDDELSDMAELLESLKSLRKEQATLKRNIEIEKANTVSKDNAPHAVKSLLELKQRDTLGLTVTDIQERKKARNLMPSLYRKITLKFGRSEAKVEFYGVDGTTDTMTLKR